MPQSLAKVYLHVVFSTKNREPLIRTEWRHELFAILSHLLKNLGCRAETIGGVEDHVHLLWELSRTKTIADVMGTIKSQSSRWAMERSGQSFQWQAGYAAFSVSQSQRDGVRRYIDNQELHHQNQGFQDELREWLRMHEIPWDEHYVWD
jgi:REP element-mobilizing transposase RayT